MRFTSGVAIASAYHNADFRGARRVVAMCVGWEGAALFDHLWSLSDYFATDKVVVDNEYWFYRDNDSIEEYIGLGSRAVLTLRKKLVKEGLLKMRKMHNARLNKTVMHYTIDIPGLGFLLEKSETAQRRNVQTETAQRASGTETKTAQRRNGSLRSAETVPIIPLPKETDLRDITTGTGQQADLGLVDEVTREQILDGVFDGKAAAGLSRSHGLIHGLIREWGLTHQTRPQKPSNGRIKLVRKALAAGYEPSMLLKAFEGMFFSAHHMGQNDRNTKYNEISNALKNDNTEKFAGLWDENVEPRRRRGDADDKPRIHRHIPQQKKQEPTVTKTEEELKLEDEEFGASFAAQAEKQKNRDPKEIEREKREQQESDWCS